MLDKEKMLYAYEDIKYLRKSFIDMNEEIDETHPRAKSLLNLKHYLHLRSKDHTMLQEKLFFLGLSSLGRSYAHIFASINNIYEQLTSSLNKEQIFTNSHATHNYINIQEALDTASNNAKELFGKKTGSFFSRQHTAVMVTLPSNAAESNGLLIRQLADVGVNVFRINTAHDAPSVWKSMADIIQDININKEEDEKIKIFVDLAGPKIRTGKIRTIDIPLKIGSNKEQKELVLTCSNDGTTGEILDSSTLKKIPAQITVEKSFFNKIAKNDKIKVFGFEDQKAHIIVKEVNNDFIQGYIDKKIYIDNNTEFIHEKYKSKVKNFQHQTEPIRLFIGDHLVITEKEVLGRAAIRNDKNEVTSPALIRCIAKNILFYVLVGDKVFIDDGKIALEVLEKNDDTITCKVLSAKSSGTLLKEEKGINFPDTYVETSAITATDEANVLHVLPYADSLSISFCQNADDVKKIQTILYEHGRDDIGIIAKIETKIAITNMPNILQQLLESKKYGVMIARGDLAIEVGFEKMAYVQEALLDICDAAHVPVIWATQVLESKMKNNLPSRAEVTDAAMSGRAECVMLNKGAFAIDTIDVLKRILDDMHSISKKNRQLLKKEPLWY